MERAQKNDLFYYVGGGGGGGGDGGSGNGSGGGGGRDDKCYELSGVLFFGGALAWYGQSSCARCHRSAKVV